MGDVRTGETPVATCQRRRTDDGRTAAAALLRAAADGDRAAWSELVGRYGRMIFAVARRVGLSRADAGDVCQTTWLRLTQHLDSIHDPERVGAWLATTARREAIRISQRARRTTPRDQIETVLPATHDRLDYAWVNHDRDRILHQVCAELPETARTLLSLLMSDPPLSYRQLSRITGMPIGSIGPTRARILSRLRDELAARGVTRVDLDEAG